jgi:ATP-dependent Clp protease ATP-binding subunit ClpB
MNFEKYTTKAAEVMQSAQQMATQHKNPAIDEPHLLYAMLQQDD